MNNFIEEFYFGNINPQCRKIKSGSCFKKILDNVSKLEDELLNKLDEQGKELYMSYLDTSMRLSSEGEKESFVYGFRLGAKFTYDTFINENQQTTNL